MRTLAFVLSAVLAGPPPDEAPPGGYWRLGEQREAEPDDGRDNIVVGSILASLGVLRAGGGAVQVYLGWPTQCSRLEARTGIAPDGCAGMRALGWVGVAFGGLMAVTGATMLGIGAAQRRRHAAWKRRYGLALVPVVGLGGGGAELSLRF